MNETIEDIIREMREGFDMSWHDVDREWAHDLADRIDAAARPRRELLCRLRDDNIELKIENLKLCALVNELADALDYSVQEHAWIVGCEESGRVCSGCSSEKCVNNKRRSLVAKAREAIGGAK